MNSRTTGSAPERISALAVVPARLGSIRLPRKMLLRASGHYLFEHTVRGVQRSRSLARVVVATDSQEILAAAEEIGVEALLTSGAHASGTDRVHEAHDQLVARGLGPFDVVLNVQGDEPEVRGESLDPLIAAFADPAVRVASLCTALAPGEGSEDPSVVKVVLDRNGDALYFSRAPIPGLSQAARERTDTPFLRHIGVYAFRPEALRQFCSLPRGTLEQVESLEQLRWLEAGQRIRVLHTADGSVGIDTAEQYAQFVVRERARSTPNPSACARTQGVQA